MREVNRIQYLKDKRGSGGKYDEEKILKEDKYFVEDGVIMNGLVLCGLCGSILS